jgi:RimJ/RimL family protein N-acetyltransferase
VLGIVPYAAPIEWAYRRRETGELTPVQPGMFAVRSQDLEAAYHDAGVLYFFPTAYVLRGGAGDDTQYVGHPLPRERGVDIDTPKDWALAEALFAGRTGRRHAASGARRLAFVKDRGRIDLPGGGYLRALGVGDVTSAYVDGLNDFEVQRFLTLARGVTHSLESVRSYVVQNRDDCAAVLFGIYTGDALRGTLRLHNIDFAAGFANLGIALFDRTVWGRGVATAAVAAASRFARDVLGIGRLEAGVYEANAASRRIFEKAGFRRRPDSRRATELGDAYFWEFVGADPIENAAPLRPNAD